MDGVRTMSLLIHGADEVVQVATKGKLVKTGSSMNNLEILCRTRREGLSIAVDEVGLISAVGYDSDVKEQFRDVKWTKVIDAYGKSVIPGLVDGHTHPVWAGDRVHEFAMKLAGKSYMEIHEAGGGIHYTVEHTQSATEKELLETLLQRLERMSANGTTLAECKSGYGLNTETEIKMLKVLEMARPLAPLSLSTTFLGHAVPKVMTPLEAAKRILDDQLPGVLLAIGNGEISVDNIDVFCEKGVFNVEQSRLILEAGKEIGLNLNFHGDELNPMGAAEMGAALNAEAISHLEEISDAGILAMAQSQTVGVLLPTTAYLLRLKRPPARKMIDAGVPVALGSDFNPNAYCFSMPIAMNMACVLLHMTLNEALVASTLNAAYSLRQSETCGSIEVGKLANLVIIDAPRWEHLVYRIGEATDTISHVIYKGRVVQE